MHRRFLQNVKSWAAMHYQQWQAQGNSLPEVVADVKEEEG